MGISWKSLGEDLFFLFTDASNTNSNLMGKYFELAIVGVLFKMNRYIKVFSSTIFRNVEHEIVNCKFQIRQQKKWF